MLRSTSSYAWLATLQWTDRQGVVESATAFGTVPVHEGSTQSTLTATVLELAREEIGAPGHAAVVFLSLEPNDLRL